MVLNQKEKHGSVRPLFEGGQVPLIKKLPHMRGFTNIFKIFYTPINLDILNSFDNGSKVNVESLIEKKILRRKDSLIKILGRGNLTKDLEVSAHSFSKTAVKKIEKAGGKVNTLSK